MTKMKKLLLSLGVACVMCVALIVGLIASLKSPKPLVSGGGDYINSKEITTYNFDVGEVKVKRGSSNLKYSYIPNPNSKSGSSVAYEYTFSNPMASTMGVNLKSIDTTGVTVSYAYSDTKLSNITSGTSPFEFQKLNQHVTRYIYIIVTPTSDEIPSTFQANVVWYQGKAGTVTTYDTSGNTISTQEIVKGQPIDEPETPTVEEGYEFGGWYLDEECTIPADFNSIQGVTLYPKIQKPYPTANLPSDWLAWDSSTSSYYVTTGTSTLPTELVIPQTHNDGTNGEANVTYIYSASSGSSGVFYNQTSLTSVTLPNTLTSIGNNAFRGCSGLTNVDLTYCTSLSSIGDSALYGCSSLSSIDLPISLTTIGSFAFRDCSVLTSITLPSSLTSIGSYAFYQCSGLTSISLPTSLTSIGTYTFYKNGLTSIDLSKCTSLTSIGSNAFAYCSGLTSARLPSSVTSVTYDAFRDCSVLTSIVVSSGNSVYDSRDNCNAIIETETNTLIAGCKNTTIPSTVTSIGNYAFRYCSGLTSIDLSQGTSLTSIGNQAFRYCSGLTSITLPSGLTSIGSYAFRDCSVLTSIDLSKCTNLNSIDENVFAYCSGLTSITLPSSVTSIGINAFYSCSGLTSMDLSKCTSLTSIGEKAFQDCTELTSITLPSSLTSIGYYAFSYCSGLTKITIPANVTKIGAYAFSNTGLTSMTFSDKSTWYYVKSETNWNNMTGGTSTSVSNASTNATYFTSTYKNYYWYKL